MKKMLSIILAAAMLLCCVPAFAESEIVPAYKLITTIPDGYELENEQWITPFIVTQALRPTAEGKPAILTVVSYNDAFSDITFNADMEEEEFNKQVAALVVDEESGDELPYEIRETGLGTKVVVITYPGNYLEFYSIWHGYEVSLFATNYDEENNASMPTKDQVDVIMQFLTDMDFQSIIQTAE